MTRQQPHGREVQVVTLRWLTVGLQARVLLGPCRPLGLLFWRCAPGSCWSPGSPAPAPAPDAKRSRLPPVPLWDRAPVARSPAMPGCPGSIACTPGGCMPVFANSPGCGYVLETC